MGITDKLTLSRGEGSNVVAPLLCTFLISDDFHLCLLWTIHGDRKALLRELQPLVSLAGEAPANYGSLILEGETVGAERQADQQSIHSEC